MVTIRVHAVNGQGELPQPVFLKSWDIEAHDGGGNAEYTEDEAEAYQFADFAEAIRVWNSQSVTRPLRDDGKPNKPLTALTIEIA